MSIENSVPVFSQLNAMIRWIPNPRISAKAAQLLSFPKNVRHASTHFDCQQVHRG
jgi:hypothetical protein